MGALALFCALVPTTLVSCGGTGLVFRAILTAGVSLFFEGFSGGYAPVDPAFLPVPVTTPAPPMVLRAGQRAERYVFAGGDLLSPVHIEGTASGTQGTALRIALELRRADEADFTPLPGVEATIDPAVQGPEVSLDLPGFDQVPAIEPGDVLRLVLEAIGGQGQITFSDDLKKRTIQATIGDLLDRTQSLVLAQTAPLPQTGQSQGVFGSAPRTAGAGSTYASLVLQAGETNLPYRYQATDLHTFSVGAVGAPPDRITCVYEGPVCFSLLARSVGAQATFEVALLVRDSQGGALQGIQLSSFAGPFTVGGQAERIEGGFDALPPQITVETTSGTDAIPAPFELVVRVTAGSDPLELVFDAQDETQRSTVQIPGPNVTLHYPGGVDVPITQPTRDFAQIDPRCTPQAAAQAAATSGGSGSGGAAASIPAALLLTPAQPSVSEAAGPGGLLVTLSRTGDPSQSLEVALTSSDPTALQVPATVTIPAGSRQIGVALDPTDDILLDGDQPATITALAPGFRGAFETVSIVDDELAVVPDTPMLLEGGQVQVAITRAETQGDLTVALSLSDPAQASAPSQITIADGQATGRLTVDGAADGLLDGDQTVTLHATAPAFAPQDIALTILDRDLQLQLAAAAIPERGGRTTLTVRRGASAGNLRLSLASSDPTEAQVAATATIPDGQQQVVVAVNAQDDTALDGAQPVTLTVRGRGFQTARTLVRVLDDDLSLTLRDASVSEGAGAQATRGTIRRGDRSGALVVSLTSSRPQDATVPAQVTIPSGSTFASFDVAAVANLVVDGTRNLSIAASATGYANAAARLAVTDDETLAVRTTATSVAESSTTGVALTIVRSNTDEAQTVQLTSSDPTRLTVPASVALPRGRARAQVTATPVDNQTADGNASVVVSLQATGLPSAQATIDVIDDEQPALQVTLPSGTALENAAPIVATVTRNTPATATLTVTLASSNRAAATIPASVTIAANAQSATFVVTPTDNRLLDGHRTTQLLASAAGHAAGTGSLTVTDDEPAAIQRGSQITRRAQTAPPANGTTNVVVTVLLQDAVGVFAGQTVELVVNPTGTLVQRTTGRTDASGRFTTSIGANAPGRVTVRARVVSQGAGTFSLPSSLQVDFVDLLATPRKIQLPGPTAFVAKPAPVSVAAGDLLAKDGLVDLAVAVAGTEEVVTYLGDGQGGLKESLHVGSKGPKAVEIAPLAAGGPSQLILAESGQVLTFEDAGAGGAVDLAARLTLPSRGPLTLALGLYDRDLAADIVTADVVGAAVFASGSQYSNTRVVTGPQVGDAAFVRRGEVAISLPQTGQVQVLRSAVGAGFQLVGRISVGAGVSDLLAVDLDGDQTREIVAVNPRSDELFVLRWDGAALKIMGRLTAGKGPFAVEAADMNRDGLVDLCVLNQRSQTVSLLLGDGKGAFQSLTSQAVTGNVPTDLAIADLNRDGAPDVIVSDQLDGTLSVFFGRP